MVQEEHQIVGDQITANVGPNNVNLIIGKDIVQIVLPDRTIKLGTEEQTAHLAEYRAFVRKRFAYLQLAGIPPVSLRGDIPLDRVYIKLRALPEQRYSQEATTPSTKDSSLDETLSAVRRLGEQQWQQWQEEKRREREQFAITAEEALKDRCLVMLGVPGAGKSTLMRYLARRYAADPNAYLPLLIPLSRLDTFMLQRNPALLGAVLELLTEEHLEGESQVCLQAAIGKVIADKRALFLFDGLDEVRFRRREILDGLASLASSGQSVVVTSRPVGYERLSGGYRHYEMLPLLPNDAKQFADHWFDILAEIQGVSPEKRKGWTDERANWLKGQLDERPSLRDIAQNPLMLTFLAILAGDEPRRDLPRCRKDLYCEYVGRLFTAWEAYRRAEGELVIGDLTGEKARKVGIWGLCEIAYLLQFGYYGDHPNCLPIGNQVEHSLSGSIERQWAMSRLDTQTLPAEILDFWRVAGLVDAYWLNAQEWLLFRHQTFQEYGAARALSEHFASDLTALWTELKPYLHKSGWTEVCPLVLACLADVGVDVTEIIENLLDSNAPYEDWYRNLFLVVRALADGARIDDRTQQNILEMLVHLAKTEEPRRYERRKSAEDAFLGMVTIGWSSPDLIFPYIRTIAQANVEPWRRIRAVEAMGKIGFRKESFPLLYAAAEDRAIDFEWRLVAAWSLGRLGYSGDAATILKTILEKEEISEWQAFKMVEILMELGQQTASVKLLLAIGQNPECSTSDRIRAVEKLMKLGQQTASVKLLLAIGQNPECSTSDRIRAVEKLLKLNTEEQNANQ